MNLIRLKQLNSGELYSFFSSKFVTGEVVRPYETGSFTTRSELLTFETVVSGQMANLSGNLYRTGDFLSTGIIQSTGINLYNSIYSSGQTCWIRDESLSGTFNRTGLNIINLITGLSGAFDRTGANLESRFTSLSGAFNQSGLNLYNFILQVSGNFVNSGSGNYTSLTGLSGAFDRTGLNLINLITGLSGAFDQTGWNLYDRINAVSGRLNVSGVYLTDMINSLSGLFNSSGLYLNNIITGLSGAFDRTGINNYNLLLMLSGTVNTSGLMLTSEFNSFYTGFTTLNGMSGSVVVTGLGAITSYKSGANLIVFSGQSGASSPAKVVSINNLTGNVFITGTGNINVYTLGSGIYVSGNFISTTDTGNFATAESLSATGQTLLNRDANISGYLKTLITGGTAGVLSINSFSGTVNIKAGSGISITGNNNDIFINYSGLSLPGFVQNSPDIFVPTIYEDDFNEPYLNSRWTGINTNADSSGINNSHFWINGKASASSTGRSIFLQGVTTGEDWEILMKCNANVRLINYNGFGLFIGNANSNKNTFFGYEYNSNPFSVIRHYNFYSSVGSIGSEGSSSGYYQGYKNMYFRLRSRSNTMSFDISNEGVIWRNHRTFFYTGNAPSIDQIGFLVNPNGSQVGLAVDYFRVTGVS